MSDQNKRDCQAQDSGPDTAETPQEAQAATEAREQEAPPEGQAAEQPQEKTEAEKLQEQVDSLNDRLLRTMAEYDNFRRRSQREKEAIYPQATAAAVSQLVPILDTFDRALGAPCSDEEFKKGVEMILANFKEVLGKLGVEEFAEAGEPFDPEIHNAVMHVEDDSLESGVIVEVFQKGYRLGDRIIRHAMVKVAN